MVSTGVVQGTANTGAATKVANPNHSKKQQKNQEFRNELRTCACSTNRFCSLANEKNLNAHGVCAWLRACEPRLRETAMMLYPDTIE
jgi:hypothetical protein